MAVPHIGRIISKVLAAAENARIDAGYGGRWDDGGASSMEAQVRFYQAGVKGQLPKEWEKYAITAEHEADPEYAEYVRLKKKFDK